MGLWFFPSSKSTPDIFETSVEITCLTLIVVTVYIRSNNDLCFIITDKTISYDC